jgi:hypothetical protein
MEQIGASNPIRMSCGLSLLMAVLTFLSMWGGLTLWLNDPAGPAAPPSLDTPRGLLISLLLCWIPLLTGSLACLAGLMSLAVGNLGLEARRQATIGVALGLIPACLAAAWLGWVLR